MEPRYVIILDYNIGALNIIELTDEEIEESKNEEKYNDFETFLATIGDKYGFNLNDCNWMVTESPNTYIYKNGMEVSNESFENLILKL